MSTATLRALGAQTRNRVVSSSSASAPKRASCSRAFPPSLLPSFLSMGHGQDLVDHVEKHADEIGSMVNGILALREGLFQPESVEQHPELLAILGSKWRLASGLQVSLYVRPHRPRVPDVGERLDRREVPFAERARFQLLEQ